MVSSKRFMVQRVADNADDPATPHQFVVVDFREQAPAAAPLDPPPFTDELGVGYVGPLLTQAEAAVIADALNVASAAGRLDT